MAQVNVYLLIGGRHDGRRLEINHEPHEILLNWPAALPSVADFDPRRAALVRRAMTVVDKDRYVKTDFHFPGRHSIIVYAHDSLKPSDVLQALIDSYTPREKLSS